jgi:hypothetical protein
MRPGDEKTAPWPFRASSVFGDGHSLKNGNMIYILRLFDSLVSLGYSNFSQPSSNLWEWIRKYQITAPEDAQDNLWVGFFEDMIDWDEGTKFIFNFCLILPFS